MGIPRDLTGACDGVVVRTTGGDKRARSSEARLYREGASSYRLTSGASLLARLISWRD